MVKIFAVQGLSFTDSTGKCSRTSTKIDDTIPLGFIRGKTVLIIPDPPGLKKKSKYYCLDSFVQLHFICTTIIACHMAFFSQKPSRFDPVFCFGVACVSAANSCLLRSTHWGK